MVFNFKFLRTCVAGLAIFMGGCSALNDQPKSVRSFQSESLNLSCLEAAPNHLKKLFEGGYTASTTDQAEIASIWSCLNRALTLFSKNTRGASPDHYTSGELQQFANRFLSDNQGFTRKFVDAMFLLKKGVLGGTTEHLTRPEIEALTGKLSQFGNIIGVLAPHLATLQSRNPTNPEARKAASRSLQIFVDGLADLLEDSANPIPWADLHFFIVELDAYLNPGKKLGILVKIIEQIPLFQGFKLLLVGGDEAMIERLKWRPILVSVSGLYRAFLESENSAELFQELNLTISSTETDQRIAVSRINVALRNIKDRPESASHDTIVNLADRWAKALFINAILFPKYQGSLALKTFLNSPSMRKIAGLVIDQASSIGKLPEGQSPDVLTLQSLSDNVRDLIQLAATARVPLLSQINPVELLDYMKSLETYFNNKKQYNIFKEAIPMLPALRSLLLGKTSSLIPLTDLHDLIKKGTTLTFLFYEENRNTRPTNETDFALKINRALETYLGELPPAFLQRDTILLVLDQSELILKTAQINSGLDFKRMRDLTHWAFELKKMLFSETSDRMELDQMRTLYNAYHAWSKPLIDARSSFLVTGSSLTLTDAQWAETLNGLSWYLRSNPFQSVDLGTFLATIRKMFDDLFPGKWPDEITADVVGPLKAVLWAGSESRMNPEEYARAVQLASRYFKKLSLPLKQTPKPWFNGITAQTMELSEIIVTLLANYQQEVLGWTPENKMGFNANALKNFLSKYGPKIGLSIRESSLETLLIGLTHRVLQRQNNERPTRLSTLITPTQLHDISSVLRELTDDLRDIESAYQDNDRGKVTRPLERKFLQEALKQATNKKHLLIYPPQLDGHTHFMRFAKRGEILNDYFAFDLAYKALIRKVVEWVFPGFMLEGDPKHLKEIRLNKSDLTDLLACINPTLFDLGISFSGDGPDVVAGKRMVTTNLFTTTGNGDAFMDPDETVEFLTMSLAGQLQFTKARDEILKLCPQSEKGRIAGSCLVPLYFSLDFYQRQFGDFTPQMLTALTHLSLSDRETYIRSTLIAVKPTLTEKSDFGLDDLQTLSNLPLYIENVFYRLDKNLNAQLEFSEAMKGFPVFCNEIKKAGKGAIKGSCVPDESPYQLEALYGYLIMKGEAPRGIKPGDTTWMKLRQARIWLGWVRYWNRLYKDPEVRDVLPPFLKRYDMMGILANLSLATQPNINDLVWVTQEEP